MLVESLKERGYVSPHKNGLKQYVCGLALLLWLACAPTYQSPCSARPGFDQAVRHELTDNHADEPEMVHVRPPASRTEVLATLRAVARALRDAPVERGVNVHAHIPLTFFEGLSCAELLAPFGSADFCETNPNHTMISFYRLPPHSVGGGRELSLHFDERGYCDGARWCATQ
jgi:hypothetical protein